MAAGGKKINMRIHLVTDRFSLGGGIEHIYQIVKGLEDIEFGIFAQPGPAVDKFKGLTNVEIHDKGYSPGYVMEKSPHLVHIHHLRPLLAFFKNPLASYRVPVLFTAHGLHIHKYEFIPSLKARLSYFLRFQLEKRIFARPRRVIAVSREDQRFLEERYHLGNVAYLTNGIDFSACAAVERQAKQELRRKLELPADDFLFVTVARFDFQKGYDILLYALASLKESLEKHRCRFIWVGDGNEFQAMKQLSRQLSVSSCIDFLGARANVYEILKAGDVFLLPSRWEGLPIALLEAGLLKVPVIASATYGNREIINESNGILFKNRDSRDLARVIMEVLDNPHDLTAYGENLFREVKTHYHLETMLTGLRKIYREDSA
jgi:glycosyltransferase involved in cell wall biosynthesis